MDISFYNAVVGSGQQQKRLDIIANNIANVNTDGYKYQRGKFVDMLYNNIHNARDEQLDEERAASARIEKTDIDFLQGSVMASEGKYDFAIKGTGFFAVYDNENQEIKYTRKGDFRLAEFGDNTFYLTTVGGEFVMDSNGQAITVDPDDDDQVLEPGIYDFINYQGMLAEGDVYYVPVDKNGRPYLNGDAKLCRGYLEKSNTNLADEFPEMIEAQRAYQAQLRMITTSDQLEQTINSLR